MRSFTDMRTGNGLLHCLSHERVLPVRERQLESVREREREI